MDRQNKTYFETEIYIDDDGLQAIMDRLIADERSKMVWLTGGKVAILWNPAEANFVTTFPAPPPAPKLHISDILQAMIASMIRTGHADRRENAVLKLSRQIDCSEDTVRGWLIGEPVPAKAYLYLIERAKSVAVLGAPLDISMVDRLREFAAEAERGS